MIVAITGGTGMIGRRLVRRHLDLGDVVRVLTRRARAGQAAEAGLHWVSADLGDGPERLAPFVAGADLLYHCAAELQHEARMEAVNVRGTENLLAAAAGRVGRWVQLSSVGVYGPAGDAVVDEDAPLRPANMYERTKAESDRLVEAAARAGRIVCTRLRPSNVYAPDMGNQSLNGLIRMVQRGWFFFIGPPGASANYIHADNVAEALLRCALAPAAAGRSYNLSDHRSMEQLIAAIAAGLGRPPPRWRLPAGPVRALARFAGRLPASPLTPSRVAALSQRSRYPTDRIEAELGYRHLVSVEDGMAEMARAFLARQAAAGAAPGPGGRR